MACDDSVVRSVAGKSQLIRRARGFVPTPFDLSMKEDFPPLLACGGDLKNTFCLTRGKSALMSQHMGDLENASTLTHYQLAVQHFCDFYNVQPRAIAHDLHPDYHSTRFALAIDNVPHIAVQHHHAHIASCMAENKLTGQIIGAFAASATCSHSSSLVVKPPFTPRRVLRLAYSCNWVCHPKMQGNAFPRSLVRKSTLFRNRSNAE